MQPDTLLRVASVSKPITAVAVLQLVEAGRFSLDSRLVDVLGPETMPPARIRDARWRQITIRHLLRHEAGFDSTRFIDPVFLEPEDYRALLPAVPPRTRDIFLGMLEQPLQFAPGTRFAYSNLGYLILGLVIEQSTGLPYEEYVRRNVFAPAGIQRALLTQGPVTTRAPGEAEYYAPSSLPSRPNADDPEQLVRPGRGDFWLQHAAAAGGWVLSAPDLLRLALAVDGQRGRALLSASSLRAVLEKPSYIPRQDDVWYGLGFVVQSGAAGFTLAHNGHLDGNYADFVRFSANGFVYVILLNGAPEPARLVQFIADVQTTMLAFASPAPSPLPADQWDTYFPSERPRLAESAPLHGATQIPAPIAPGAVLTLFGESLATAALAATPTAGMLPRELAGTRVLLDEMPLPLLYVSPTQVNAIVPPGVTLGSNVSLVVERNAVRSNHLVRPAAATSPGLFSLSGNGRGFAAALNQNGTPNGASNPAPAGSVVSLFAAGLGAFDSLIQTDLAPSAPVPLRELPRVSVAGQPAALLYAGTSPGSAAALAQINVRLPSSVTGRVPVAIEVPGAAARELLLFVQ
jgi:N-acyl-D-amino-acid deacylase